MVLCRLRKRLGNRESVNDKQKETKSRERDARKEKAEEQGTWVETI